VDGDCFGQPVGASELNAALEPDALAAVHVIDACIREVHVAEVDYRPEGGSVETLVVRPAFIRTSTAGHLVLWCMPEELDDWRELRLDRLTGARDTGRSFTPSWT
jgi:predicted DNA-binding transcriptional regulator YafY